MKVKQPERWIECYRVGKEVARKLPTVHTEREIAEAFGMKNHQKAHHESLVALGRLVIRARKLVSPPPPHKKPNA